MKHKFWTVLLALAAILCLCLGLTSCGGKGSESVTSGDSGTTPSGHTHTYAETWSSDESGHWHAATCSHSEEREDVGAHTYENGKCTTCDYEHVGHTFGEYTDKTDDGHTGTCSVCGKVVTEEHSYKDGACIKCEYEHAEHAYENGKCTECGYEHEEHTFDEYTEKTDADHTGTCSVCHKVVTEEHSYDNGVCTECEYEHQNHTYEKGVCTECHYAHKDHTYGNDNTCSVCGAKKPYTKSEDGTIYFGEYPQTEVKESGLKGMLGMEAGANPSSDSAGKWKDYGYYISGSVQSYMWYIDVDYQGSRYRGVYFTGYRPYWTTISSNTGNSYQDDNGYNTDTVYWFKYEPIEWRILEQKDGTALLMANIILDSQQYYHEAVGSRTIDGKMVYLNNYRDSDIRKWLTDTFYETAFDELAKQIIETTTVDNSASSTASSSNEFACENTQDKVFLLSYQDVLNTSYGFSSSGSSSETRQLKSTDYAKLQGIYICKDDPYLGNGWWWLRSPNVYDSHCANSVYNVGSVNADSIVYTTRGGVVPALWIRL